jgi:hypothetical protein
VRLDVQAVARFYAADRVATLWYRGAALGGLGRPRPACLECAGDRLTLYDAGKAVVFSAPVTSVRVRTGVARLRLTVNGESYTLRAVDAVSLRHRGGPALYLEYMDHFQTIDRPPGTEHWRNPLPRTPNVEFKGVWVGLWKDLLVRRGATEG